MRNSLIAIALAGLALLAAPAARAQERVLCPDAVVDLRTDAGARLVKAQWRSAPAKIIEVDHRAVGQDLKPSGPPTRTHDIAPRAGAADFEDSAWDTLQPTDLERRLGTGKLSFNWYRTKLTVPHRIGDLDMAGSTIYFEIVVDDYAEVWVNGELPRVLGSAGGQLIKGWNAPNRVLLTRNARPGQTFQLAIFAANGPLSEPPGNFIWVRSATLDVYQAGRLSLGQKVATNIVRSDPALDLIVPKGATIEKLADGFGFTEGPVWVDGAGGETGYLLFSDPNNNTIYLWASDTGDISVFRTHSGYTGANIGEYHQPGSNGLALDPLLGRLTICEHGNRRVTRLEKNGQITVLADEFEGKRLNSPNDLVYRSDGTLYFTDPPFGLPKVFDDSRKELPFSGVFCLTRDGRLKLVARDMTGPNGLAFSPDEKFLYVDNWDEHRKVVMRYEVAADGTLSSGSVFVDVTSAPGEEALDGLKVDQDGNVYFSGPGGVWIVSPAGKVLGIIAGPQLPANFTFGDSDRRTLYLCARTGLYRIRLNIAGAQRRAAESAGAKG